MSSRPSASTYGKVLISSMETAPTTRSSRLLGRRATTTPSGTPTSRARKTPLKARATVSGTTCKMRVATGTPLKKSVPRLPWTTPHMKFQTCTGSG